MIRTQWSENRWLMCRSPRPGAMVRMITFPPAGAGPAYFTGWGGALPRWMEVWSVLAPGRETRFGEPFPRTLDEHVDGVMAAVEAIAGIPVALFGHSMGAVVAFEVARRLERDGSAPPLHLFVSAARAPSVVQYRKEWDGMEDGVLLEEVQRRLGGFPEGVERDSDLLALALRVLRADLMALARHTFSSGDPLMVAMTALGGLEDPEVSEADLNAWAAETQAEFSVALFPGNHRYIEANQGNVLNLVRQTLKSAIRSR